MRENPVKAKLQRGESVFGTMVFEFATPGMPAILAAAGADFVLYDMEHSGIGYAEMKRQLSYCRGVGVVPIVRPPEKTYAAVARLLDLGAMGLMLQMVGTAEEAAEIVSWTRYPPDGVRGAVFGGAHDDYTGGDIAAKMAAAARRTIVMPMIETAQGLANVEAILAVPGVDGVHIGQFDLSLSLGVPGHFDDPLIPAAIGRILAACRAHGKFAGCMATDEVNALAWHAQGFRMVSCFHDMGLFQAALAGMIRSLRKAR
jgi:2-keto-3-deoxy-L-rhamnonate aldolase RhmA